MTKHAVLMGNPLFFHIHFGWNPHTRTSWGLLKTVNRTHAFRQWKNLKETLESWGAHVFVLQPQKEYPSMVFTANAGFIYPKYEPIPISKKKFCLSRFSSQRSDESLVYHQFASALKMDVHILPHDCEGEADFFPCGDAYIFSASTLFPAGWGLRFKLPPVHFDYAQRKDLQNLGELEKTVRPKPIIPVCVKDTAFWHADTVLFAFGKKREYLLAYLEAFDKESREKLASYFGTRIIPLSKKDAQSFAANSFQLETPQGPHILLPEGVSNDVTNFIRTVGIPFTKVDVSEFIQKCGCGIKSLICDLGPYQID